MAVSVGAFFCAAQHHGVSSGGGSGSGGSGAGTVEATSPVLLLGGDPAVLIESTCKVGEGWVRVRGRRREGWVRVRGAENIGGR